MAKTHFKGTPVNTAGDLPPVGSKIPAFTVVGTNLADITEGSFPGKRVVLNIFPSIDTGVCAQSVRRFNEEVSRLENANVLCISADLPFALDRFCGAEGIENVTAASSFRSSFGSDFGVTLMESPLAGLLARAVIVVDEDGTVLHSQLVDEIGHEPDYDAAIAALN
ncbi:thiol peroxidase (atypical 2-Cys peroxiredoxin) [Corynebacterium mustelae]|uniref:Thiol peroxidase n=1 Tax=Corynebacterium mustelae TaxID=571915 RepID=A0A0G3GY19_9CORY|nr:thiol peroxidase [Corynebacterium mustelae]AKK06061.1 thiol peroxidase (atypical 2-Cys peroxiredoxin) [Corynebacterium mustelae]